MSGAPVEFPIDLRQGVIWAYRHLLGREPTTETDVAVHMGHSVQSLRAAFIDTAEYRATQLQTPITAALHTVVDQFHPFATEPPIAGAWRNFLGVQTRCSFLPIDCQPWAGRNLAPPGRGVSGVHDEAEWLGTLRAVLEAGTRFVLVELGAGWGPWLVSGAAAAARKNIRDLLLIGVEGSFGHVEFMRQHFLDNGLDPARHRLLHGVIGTSDGIAYFPRLTQPQDNYGAEANYDCEGDTTEMERVPTISLATLLDDVPWVDVLHCDIQGMEAQVLRSARSTVDEKVGRVVVGTHSRAVEGELHSFFSAGGWVLEADIACQYIQAETGALILSHDGTQVWRNPHRNNGRSPSIST